MSRLIQLFAGLVNVVTRNNTQSGHGPSVGFFLLEGGGLKDFSLPGQSTQPRISSRESLNSLLVPRAAGSMEPSSSDTPEEKASGTNLRVLLGRAAAEVQHGLTGANLMVVKHDGWCPSLLTHSMTSCRCSPEMTIQPFEEIDAQPGHCHQQGQRRAPYPGIAAVHLTNEEH